MTAHECPRPVGPNLAPMGVGPVWVCPECGVHWQYVKPFGMYPGWRPVQVGPLPEDAYTAAEVWR